MVEVLKDEPETISFLGTMNNLFEVNDVLIVAKFLQDGNLTDSRARDSIVAMVDLDLLYCYRLVGGLFYCLVYNTIGALTKSLAIFISASELFWCFYGAVVTTTCPSVSLTGLLVFLLLLLRTVVVLRSNGYRERGLSRLHRKLSLNHRDVLSFNVHGC